MALQLTLQLKATGGQNQCNWLRGHSNSREGTLNARLDHIVSYGLLLLRLLQERMELHVKKLPLARKHRGLRGIKLQGILGLSPSLLLNLFTRIPIQNDMEALRTGI